MSDINEMQKKAIEIREKYSRRDSKKWSIEQVFMGMIKDVGDLSKLLMVNRGYRSDAKGDNKKNIEHELADVLWCVLVLSDKLDVDLEKAFFRTMKDLEKRLK